MSVFHIRSHNQVNERFATLVSVTKGLRDNLVESKLTFVTVMWTVHVFVH